MPPSGREEPAKRKTADAKGKWTDWIRYGAAVVVVVVVAVVAVVDGGSAVDGDSAVADVHSDGYWTCCRCA